MAMQMRPIEGMVTLTEIKEFASFSAAAQRYVRRSLDVAFHRADALAIWSRDSVEAHSISRQTHAYGALDDLRGLIPSSGALEDLPDFMGLLVTVSAFDLSQDKLDGFGAYRFLYERLLGAQVRPWLPASFCAAASLPNLHPMMRSMLLQSISEAAATAPGWSEREPSFFPEWIEKVSAD
jgi:hypothetical protein